MKNLILFALTAIWLLCSASVQANICQWTGPAMGDWSDPLNWSGGQVPGPADTVQLVGKSVILNDVTVIQSLVLTQNCTIGGAGELTVTGAFDITAGGEQTFLAKIVSTGNLTAMQATLNFNARPFIVAGMAIFKQGVFWMKDNGTFEIASTGVATFQDKTNFYSYSDYYGFVVRGVIFKTGASNMDFEALYQFKNAQINIESGSLINYFSQAPLHCMIDSTLIQISAGADLRVERILNVSNSSISGAGKILIGVGQLALKHPNTVLADIEQAGGSCTVTGGVDTLANYKLLGGSLSGGVIIKGDLNWIKGTVANLTVMGFTTISDTTATTMNQKAINGTLTMNGGGKYSGNDRLTGTLKIPSNSLFILDAKPTTVLNADLMIAGTLRKLNSDVVTVGFVINSGRIEGTGKIDGTVIVQGAIAPGVGAGTGTLAFNGPSLQAQAGSKFDVQVVNSGVSVSKDLLSLTGRFKLNGTLTLLETGQIPPGDYIVVQATDSLTGAFTQVVLPPNWQMIQNPFNITLRKLLTAPTAHFTALIVSGCAPAVVHFANESAGDSLSYNWVFPGGEPAASSEASPVVTYSTAGIYNATLTATNSLGSSVETQSFTFYPATASDFEAQICAGDTFYFDGLYLTTAGVYQKTVVNQFGCDSLISLHLTVKTVDVSVTQIGNSLMANAVGGNFQWFNCEDQTPFPGAIHPVFSPGLPGTYAVLIAQNGCIDTSVCYPLMIVGTQSPVNRESRLQVFPNPATDMLQVTWQAEMARPAPDVALLYDIYGVQKKRFDQLHWVGQTLQLDVRDLGSGPYFLLMETAGMRSTGVWLVILH